MDDAGRRRRTTWVGAALLLTGIVLCLWAAHGARQPGARLAYVVGVMLGAAGLGVLVTVLHAWRRGSLRGLDILTIAAVVLVVLGVAVVPWVRDARTHWSGAAWDRPDPEPDQAQHWVMPEGVVRLESDGEPGGTGSRLQVLDRADGHVLVDSTLQGVVVDGSLDDAGDGIAVATPTSGQVGTSTPRATAIDLRTGKVAWSRPAAAPRDLGQVAVAADDGVVVLREVATDDAPARVVAIGRSGEVAWSADGTVLTTGAPGAGPYDDDRGLVVGTTRGVVGDFGNAVQRHGGELARVVLLRSGERYEVRDAATGRVVTRADTRTVWPVAVSRDRVLWITQGDPADTCTAHATQGAATLWTAETPCLGSPLAAGGDTAAYLTGPRDGSYFDDGAVTIDLARGTVGRVPCLDTHVDPPGCSLDLAGAVVVQKPSRTTLTATPVFGGSGWDATRSEGADVEAGAGTTETWDVHSNPLARGYDGVTAVTVRDSRTGSVLGTVSSTEESRVVARGTDGSVLLSVDGHVVLFAGATD